MRPEANRFVLRAAWSIAAALWAAALWMWFDIREATVAPAAVSPPPATDPLAPRNEVADKPEPVLSPERSRPVAAAASAAVRKPQVVCGLEPRPGATPAEDDEQAYLERQGRLAVERAATALNARGDAASKALAAILQIGESARQSRPSLPPSLPDCQPGADCQARQRAAVLGAYQQSPQASDLVLEQARTSDDPFVVRLGLMVCDLQLGAPKGCAALSPRRLVQLDPDNAAAWLELAARESAATDEALFRASQATRYESTWSLPAARVEAALPADMPALQKVAVIEQTNNTIGAIALSPAHTAGRLCSENAVRDANRAQLCDRVAQLLVQRGRDLADVSVGHTIATRLPGAGAAAREARDRHRATMEWLHGEAPAEAWSCEAVEQRVRQFRDMQRGGEAAYAWRGFERSGTTVAELLRRADARQSRLATTASTAASAAAGTAPVTR